jgi:hypothetical protein
MKRLSVLLVLACAPVDTQPDKVKVVEAEKPVITAKVTTQKIATLEGCNVYRLESKIGFSYEVRYVAICNKYDEPTTVSISL